MRGTIVGVLRGGPSKEHEVSLATGHTIITNLPAERFTVRDIYIDRNGIWHERGVATTPEKTLRSMDVVINGLHGEYGEDGEVQKILERHGVPYTGSDSFGSYMAMHKVLAKERARELGILTPRYQLIEEGSNIEALAQEINRTFSHPVVVKPIKWGSSVGVSLTHGYAPLLAAIQSLLQEGSGGVLVEELIRGTEASAGVLEGLRGEEIYTFPVAEVIPPTTLGYVAAHVKYTGETRDMIPGRFLKPVSEEIQKQARRMHEALGLRDYSRSDFIVSPKGIYYLETNALPGMASESLLPKSLAAVGVSISDFLSHIVELALNRKSR